MRSVGDVEAPSSVTVVNESSLTGMITRALLITLISSSAILSDASCERRISEPSIDRLRGEINLNRAATYPQDGLRDISFDGKYILFFKTNVPMRTYTLPSNGAIRANNPRQSDDILRVVELDTGREIGRTQTNGFPEAAEFIHGTHQVLYAEKGEDSTKPGQLNKIWNPLTGGTKICLDENTLSLKDGEVGFSIMTSLTPTTAVARISQQRGDHVLVSVMLPDCALARVGPLSVAYPDMRRGGSVAYSPKRQHIAFGTREQVLIIRETKTLGLIKEIREPLGLILGEMPLYTADGKFLLAIASNTLRDEPRTKRYLLFFDTKNYEVVRKLDITNWQPLRPKEGSFPSTYIGPAMAISPDARIMAVAYQREDRGPFSVIETAEIVLYNLNTAETISTATHARLKQDRKDPFAARIHTLTFSLDGRRLFSSANDTVVWEVTDSKADRR